MLKKRLNLFGRLAFILLFLQDFGLLNAGPVLLSSQSDNDYLLQAYKEKLERQIKGADELASTAPEAIVSGNENNRLDNEYLSQIAQLEAENEALKKSMKSLEDAQQINQEIDEQRGSEEDESEFQEIMTDHDLNYPVLPDEPEEDEYEEPRGINRKRGSWHKLIQGDQGSRTMEDNIDNQFDTEQEDNPSFGHAGIRHQQSDPLLVQGVVAPMAAESRSDEKKGPDVIFEPVKTAEKKKDDNRERTATADVVTLTVAAIALLCSVIFIVFTAVQWRKTIKAIKVDQMRSNQSIKSMRSELRVMKSLSSINIDQDFDDLFNSYKDKEEQELKRRKEPEQVEVKPVILESKPPNNSRYDQDTSPEGSFTSLTKNKRKSSNHSDKVRAKKSEGKVAGQPAADMKIAARTSTPPKPKRTRASQSYKNRVYSDDEELDKLLKIAENLDTESDD